MKQRPVIARNTPISVLILLVLLVMIGCVPVTGLDVETPPVTMPPSFSDGGEQVITGVWWNEFNDPELQMLIGEALGGNFSLQAARQRFFQAQALTRRSAA